MAVQDLALIVFVLPVTIFKVSFAEVMRIGEVFSVADGHNVRCKERERQALLELKRAFVDFYGRLSSWGGGENQKECCNWIGVHCSDDTNHVVVLDLHSTSDDGDLLQLQPLGGIVLAESLSKLDYLTYLDLSYNNFNGTEIPDSIGSLFHLKYLNLSLSGFGGMIPQQLGNLQNLQYLDFHDNDLVGVIPNSLGNLSRLEYLDLAGNIGNLKSNLDWLSDLTSLQILSLSDVDLGTAITWPKLIMDLTHLKELYLSHCNLPRFGNRNFRHVEDNLSPTLTHLDLSDSDFNFTQIPEFVSSFTNLRYLDLSYCNFVGNIPDQLGALPQLQYLDLEGNSLTGVIPHQLGNLSQLQHLSLGHNNLHGYLPNQLGHLSCLQELHLENNHLGGKIPETFGNLSSIEKLTLDGNQFKGRLPNSLWDLCHLRFLSLAFNNFNERLDDFLDVTIERTPRCSDSSLQILELSYNRFRGSIPDLSYFVDLRILGLQGNELNGTVNGGIGQLSKLKELLISSNPLQGVVNEVHFSKLSKLVTLNMSHTSLFFNLSKTWVSPFNLNTLDLSYCKVGPHFPEWIKNQNSIQRLYMHHSEIADIPDWFWMVNFASLKELDLSFNNIQGEMSNLQIQNSGFPFIDLSSNQLKGEIPAFLVQVAALNLSSNMFSGSIFSLCSMASPSVSFLDFSHNQLSERLPDCWLHFEHLIILNLSFNNFSGDVPASVLSLPTLKALHLQNNKFQGIPPLSSSNLTNLQSLDLSENEISGIIPSSIGNTFPNLHLLSLRNNNFFGSMSFDICNLTQILVFDLSSNQLSGSIPKCFDQFMVLSSKLSMDPVLVYFYTTEEDEHQGTSDGAIYYDSIQIRWKGEISGYTNNLRFQRFIDLSNNQLTGEIPVEIMDLVELLSLNLSWNKLGGDISPNIGRLKNLESLDLSRNMLHGFIPPSLAQLGFLSQLNLSFNNLSGKIPKGSQLQTLDDASAYSGNSELCGAPLDIICPDNTKDNGKSNAIDQGDDENDDLIEIYGFYITMAFGFIVGFWASCGSLIF